jgi:hypothetical protein
MNATELFRRAVAAAATPRVQNLPRTLRTKTPSVAECARLIKGMVEQARRARGDASLLERAASLKLRDSSLILDYASAVAAAFMPHMFTLPRLLERRRATKAECAWLAAVLRLYSDVLSRHAEHLRKGAMVRLAEQEDRLATLHARRAGHRKR